MIIIININNLIFILNLDTDDLDNILNKKFNRNRKVKKARQLLNKP